MQSDSEEQNHEDHDHPINWVFNDAPIDNAVHLALRFLLLVNPRRRADDGVAQNHHQNNGDPIGGVPAKDYSVFGHWPSGLYDKAGSGPRRPERAFPNGYKSISSKELRCVGIIIAGLQN